MSQVCLMSEPKLPAPCCKNGLVTDRMEWGRGRGQGGEAKDGDHEVSGLNDREHAYISHQDKECRRIQKDDYSRFGHDDFEGPLRFLGMI